ncbi:MAG: class II aldolase/adducin family protein [Betaproteobacteria bacterium]|nr:class II aldolase/adducin family protein [Betaproteobacteria bacterium]
MAMNLITELVIANRILANEDVVDAYGHVSIRNPEAPDRFFLAHSKSPALVEADDIVEHTLAGQAAQPEKRPLYLERFIHAAIYEARPEVMAVVHAHAEDVLPFTITRPALRPVIHSGAFIGAEVPVWDIADQFGDRTNLLVTDIAQGRDLAKRLGANNVALMRGHGFAAAARSLIDVVRMSVYLPRNARVQFKAMQLGDMKPLSSGEIQARSAGPGYKPQSPETQRAWQYWAQRAGCAHLLKS